MNDGLCECGCGEDAPISTKTFSKIGVRKGEPFRFVRGHHRRKPDWREKFKPPIINPSGLCECGCGQPAPIATRNYGRQGWVKGQPMRFILGHFNEGRPGLRRELSPYDYTVTDGGFETECWFWNGQPIGPLGYCRVRINGRYEAAHRAYYERYVGPISKGDHLHHKCEQPRCVRPDHLEPLGVTPHMRAHSRLTEEDIAWIRTGVYYKDVVAKLGISVTHVYDIRNGKAWA